MDSRYSRYNELNKGEQEVLNMTSFGLEQALALEHARDLQMQAAQESLLTKLLGFHKK